MGGSSTAFTKSILTAIEQRLKSLSFKKQPVGFLRALEPNVSGYVGLLVSTHLPRGRIGVSAVIAVISKPVEDAIRKLSDNSPYVNELTLSTQVGYITPEANYLQWIFDPALPELTGPEIEKIIRAIGKYGLAFMHEHTTLDSIITELEAKHFTTNEVRQYRLPVIYLLAGRREKALWFVNQELEKMRTRTDAVATTYRNFAQRLKDADTPASRILTGC